MTIKPDHWIRRMAVEREDDRAFEPGRCRGVISFGLSSYGYESGWQMSQGCGEGGGVLDPKAISRGQAEESTPLLTCGPRR